MKKRIQIIVQPVDNGYTIQANATDHPSGQNAINAQLIAKNDAEVSDAISEFVDKAFAPPAAKAGPIAPITAV